MTRAGPESPRTRSALHSRRSTDRPTVRAPRRDLEHRPDRRRGGGFSAPGSSAATTQHSHGSPSSAVITNLPFGRIKISDIGNCQRRPAVCHDTRRSADRIFCSKYRIVDRGISPRCRVRIEPGCHAGSNRAIRRQVRACRRAHVPTAGQATMFASSCRTVRLGSPRCAVCGRQPNQRAASQLNSAAARAACPGWGHCAPFRIAARR